MTPCEPYDAIITLFYYSMTTCEPYDAIITLFLLIQTFLCVKELERTFMSKIKKQNFTNNKGLNEQWTILQNNRENLYTNCSVDTVDFLT